MRKNTQRRGSWRGIWHTHTIWRSIGALFLIVAVLSAFPKASHSASSQASIGVPSGIGGRTNAVEDRSASSAGIWPTYMANNARTSFNPAETAINPTTVSHLKLHWIHTASGSVSVQPVEANGQMYWGSWDGFEHATNLNNTRTWNTQIGRTTDLNCNPPSVGVASTATVASLLLGGISTPVILVGGGNSSFYALNASTGAIIWRTLLGAAPSHFLWSSPAVFQGHVYIGVSSFGDCPLVQGQLVEMNMTTGAVEHTFNVVPLGCTGGGVWGSPTIDEGSATIYFATGNPGACSQAQPLTNAMVAVRASDLSLKASWQVPRAEQVNDGDFGSTPTLFTASIRGIKRALVGVVSKNGTYYAFDRSTFAAGPLWRSRVATGGDCPQCGSGSIAPASWDGSTLYVAGGATTIKGQQCLGSVQALHPDTGIAIWQHCLHNGPVLGAVAGVPGLVVVSQGSDFNILAAATGQTRFTYRDFHSTGMFAGGASFTNGVLYIGNLDGNLYAFGL